MRSALRPADWSGPPVRSPSTRTAPFPPGWEAQTRLVFAHLGRALGAVGAGWADVVKLTLFVVDVAEVATVRDEFIDTARPPTSSLVRVAGLVRPDLLIEVEAVAWLP